MLFEDQRNLNAERPAARSVLRRCPPLTSVAIFGPEIRYKVPLEIDELVLAPPPPARCGAP